MKVLNRHLDRLARPELQIWDMTCHTYQVCGYIGLVLAVLVAMTLTVLQSLSLWVMTAIIGISILTFLGLAMATKVITGKEQLIYYHHEIAVLIAASVFLKLIDQPLLPYLDITILGIGTFLVCGRLGCLIGGCCHGRPHRWGVCYRKEHANAGFTHHYVGVRLFPIQAVESVWVLVLVVIGCGLVLGRSAPGEALAWYVIAYDIGRFSFEFLRGDPSRPYHWGFSEAQWISVILMCAVVWAELSGRLVFHTWHVVATVAMILVMIAIAVARRICRTERHKLLNPRHVSEIAEAINQVAGAAADKASVSIGNPMPEAIPVGCTSIGIQISAGRIKDTRTSIDHYALSSKTGTMSKEIAGILADLIIQLKHPTGVKELIDHNRGVFHVLVQARVAGDKI